MIPARLGSQRLKQKNLQLLKGLPLIAHAIRKVKSSGLFDEVWVNSESPEIGEVAKQEGVFFHKRPDELANNQATSEDFVYEFMSNHRCDYLVQVHSIAPLLSLLDIKCFTEQIKESKPDALLSVENIQIECAYENMPVNFTFEEKTNSQELKPVQRITWSISGWKTKTYCKAYEEGACATYAGIVSFYPVGKLAAHVIKEQEDLDFAEALFDMVHNEK